MIPFFKKTEIQSVDVGDETDYKSLVSQYCVEEFSYSNFYLNTSCTQGLELALMLLNLEEGSEVIMPSYGFVSLANAVVLNGLQCVFVDCESGTMNIDVKAALNAITKKTKAIITINYGGIACNYEELISICQQEGIFLIEDNAHGIRAKYKNQYLGSLGDISTISFDYMKNITCDEGGGMVINNDFFVDRYEQISYFGTNRVQMLKGEVNFYEWKTIGTNAILAEPLAKILYSQLFRSDEIIGKFIQKWNFYHQELSLLQEKENIEIAKIPAYSTPNGHMFWMKVKDLDERKELMNFLKEREISSAFHYTPLHQSEYGKKVGVFRGEDKVTSRDSVRLLRLPLYHSLEEKDQLRVVESIYEFYKRK